MNVSGELIVVACLAAVVAFTCNAATAAGPGIAQSATKPSAPASDAMRIERGHYLAYVGDCAACHTAADGKPLAGGVPIETGFGVIYSPNITPDRETGIGGWSSDAFYRAMHTGHDDEGKHLYPAFPYPWFTKVTRADTDSIKAYLDSVAPVHQQNKPEQLAWLMRWRATIAGWNLVNFDEGEFRSDPAKSAQWNRGAYLVEGLGHCGDCHTPKGYFGGADKREALAGGYTEGGHDNGWFAPSLRGEQRAGLGTWSSADIVTYLKSGANLHTASAGPMSNVVTQSTRHLNDGDLEAIAVYLKSMAALHDGGTPKPIARQALARGQGIFTDQCAGCHMQDGAGIPGLFPALTGSSAVQAREPASVIRIVLEGAREPGRAGQHPYIAMPAFDRKLDDGEIAAVVSYIRNAWGNRASTVDADTITKARKALVASKP